MVLLLKGSSEGLKLEYMDKEEPLIRISVRNLVEFVLRSGDIDNRAAGADRDAMLLGGKIHRKIQRKMGAEYQAEVPLKQIGRAHV